MTKEERRMTIIGLSLFSQKCYRTAHLAHKTEDQRERLLTISANAGALARSLNDERKAGR